MRVVALAFTCNNACIHCAQGKLRATSGNPSLDAERAVERAASELVRGETVALVGGEPTLDDRLPSFVSALDAAGAGRILVQTNGRRLAYRSYARLLREASERLSLEVSIAGSTEAMHDYHTGTPGSFKQTVTGLRNARAERLPASLSCVVTRSNFRHLADVVRLCHAVSARGLRLALALPLGAARELRDRVVPAPEMVAPYLTMARAEAEKIGLAVTATTTSAPEEGAAGAFAGLGPVEMETDTDARSPAPAMRIAAEQLARKDVQPSSPRDVRQSLPRDPRALPMLGRPVPGRREERTPARKTGDELRTILPSLFDGSAPREVADVVAAARLEGIAGGTG